MITPASDIISGLALSRPGLATIALIIAAVIPLTLNITLKIMTLFVRRVNILGIHPSVASVSSVLLNLMVAIPLALLLWSFNVLTPFDCIYDLVILLFCLDFASLRRSALDVAYQLRNNAKDEARNAIRPFVLREVDSLSSMGLAKATVESLPLNFLEGVYVPLFWYIIAGPTVAFFATLIVAMNKASNPKLATNVYFGKLDAYLAKIVCILPGLVMILMLGLTTSFTALKRAWEQKHLHPNPISGILIAMVGCFLEISLGGPRIYNGQKVRFANIGGNTDPAPVHIEIVYQKIRNSILLIVLLMLVVRTLFLL